MAYNIELAERLRIALEPLPGLTEKKMFGGIAYLLNGNMLCGVLNDDLILRLGKDGYQAAMSQEHTRPFDITGRPMSGWLMVDLSGCEDDVRLNAWIDQALTFVNTLPAK